MSSVEEKTSTAHDQNDAQDDSKATFVDKKSASATTAIEEKQNLSRTSVAASSSDGQLEKSPGSVNAEEAVSEQEDGGEFLSGWKLWLLSFGLCVSNFLVGLDQSILATAIPKIVTQFESLDDVGWYGSAYLLCTTALQPTFGKIYTYFNIKWTYIAALVIFEIGSIVCAVAHNSITLIIGRAIAGAGAAGLYSGGMTMIAYAVPIRSRPMYIAFLSSMFGIASIVGPILGGAFTDSHLTWRWCFWINLPFGAVAIATVLFFFRNPERSHAVTSFKDKIKNMDLIGAVFLIGAVICLLLALQWGGTTYPWGDSKVWGNFLGFGLLTIIFIGVQMKQKERATIPLRILKQRTVAASAITLTCLSMGLYVHIYYLPFYFQAVKGNSASQSGIHVVPYLISTTVTALIAGTATSVLGYYVPWIIGGSTLFTVGAGLLYTLTPTTPSPRWIGYEILTAGGAGLAIQLPFIAVQVVLPLKDVPSGNAIAVFFNTLGGAIAISAATNIFNNQLDKDLNALNVPGLNADAIVKAGPQAIRSVVPEGLLEAVLNGYNHAVVTTLLFAVAAGGLAVLSSLFFEWKSVKGKKIEHGAGGA